MKDSLLSQEEIHDLIRQVKPEDSEDGSDGEIKAVDEDCRAKNCRHNKKGLSETCKVVFNNIEPEVVPRRNAKIEELNHVTFGLKLVLGEAVLTVGELLNLKKDSLIVLNRLAGENARLLVNGKPLADGEIVVLNDCFAFRVNFMDEGKKEPVIKQAGGEKESSEPILGSS